MVLNLFRAISRRLSQDPSMEEQVHEQEGEQATSLPVGEEETGTAAVPLTSEADSLEIRSRVFSRVGLLGNPSDGYGGRCMSFSLANFHAEVVLIPSGSISFIPNPEQDVEVFGSLDGLVEHIRGQGYYGGVRILQAMCKRFTEYCRDLGIPLGNKNFTLAYSTNIPRQRGLSGSSAIALAALNCLLRYYGVEGRVPVEDRPGLALSAEEELGITVGLQDRVVQVYGGLLTMDFDPEFMAEHGHGKYLSLDPGLLPPLYIVFSREPSGKDSGGVHSYVKQRWVAGDPSVRSGMAQVASLVEPGWEALLRQDIQQLASLMRLNFRLRRQLYGDAAIGAANLRMVQVAESVGAAAKLTGSGGAVVVLCPGGAAQERQLAEACAKEGLECQRAIVGPVNVMAA